MIYKGIEIPDNLKDKVIDHIVEEYTDQFIDILTQAYLHDYRDWLKEQIKKVVCKVFENFPLVRRADNSAPLPRISFIRE